MVSRSSLYFHFERSYFLLAAFSLWLLTSSDLQAVYQEAGAECQKNFVAFSSYKPQGDKPLKMKVGVLHLRAHFTGKPKGKLMVPHLLLKLLLGLSICLHLFLQFHLQSPFYYAAIAEINGGYGSFGV